MSNCPCLWVWARLPPYSPLTVSIASINANAFWRQGLEDVAIAWTRWERKRWPVRDAAWRGFFSPLANFGKIPAGWRLSSSREVGRRGGPTPTQDESHEPSIMPLGDLDDTHDACADFWGGHRWSPWYDVHEVKMPSEARGLYRLAERDVSDLFFLGCGYLEEAARKVARAHAHLLFSAVCGSWTRHELRELRTDLIGLYVCQRKVLPVAQHGGATNRNAGNPWPLEVV